jgi:hypothetical protein
MRMSRRTILALGGSLVALASGTAVWKSRWRSGGLSGASPGTTVRVVDHKGWMLTVADKEKILEKRDADSDPAAP